jgi:hypothetical protein
MQGICEECLTKAEETGFPYCCVLCSLGILKEDTDIDENGTVIINMEDLFPCG